ncbi:MAG: nickel-responsive transcriptional regulator NikR [Comamonadaceae bacterium CG_4_9_14_3_um_filter_60_33]|nr:MAG: nickel responsive regulator [Comamonadaceae bacterium CG2_30_59_20]PIY29200.1 MAG: nickel-responsive transcriptional regulator NikR [Comamonadaceae bacterium CG_4_10_14_3_um_filter_60_42]PJB44476.1 MAG: nickel-responsive transcriptional regulator NikR [Comamonadaceae bacterium CG_4_9_14_3_um_filter_60_33]
MERITISIDSALALEFDRLIAERGYKNRSEAVRDLVRSHLEAARTARSPDGHCVANLSYVYNHHERDLAERLTALQHDQHDLTVATLHAHLDHDNCLESVILRGETKAVRIFSDALMAQRGVRHGQLNVVAVDLQGGHAHPHDRVYSQGRDPVDAAHVHLKPKT